MNERENIARVATSWTRLLWRVLALVGLLVLVDLVSSAGIRQFQRTRSESSMLEAELAQEPYRGSDWGRSYWEELGYYDVHWEPYYVYKVDDMHGRFINVVNGVRRTYLADGERPAAVVFYSGVNEILSGRGWPTLQRPRLDGDVLPQAMTQVNDERPRQTQPTVTAYPAVTHGIGRGKTTVVWATGDGTVAEVYVSIDGGPEILFAGQSTHGTQDADWIEAGAAYEFRLYAGTDHKRLLSRAFVTRLADGPGAVARSAGGSVTRQIVNVTLIAALVGCAGIAGRIAVLRNRQKAKNAGSTPD